MSDVGLAEQVVRQAQLLTGLLTTVGRDKALSSASLQIAELMLEGLSQLHDAVAGPPAPEVNPIDVRRREYLALVERVKAKVVDTVPAGSVVAIVSRGDSTLLQLGGRTGWHLPQDPMGVWAGFHPADGVEALGHLRQLQRNGARYLAIPAPSKWWLDFYREFREHLDGGTLILNEPDLVLYRLADTAPATPASAKLSRYQAHVGQFVEFADMLLPAGAVVLVATRGDDAWLGCRRVRARHFPSDAAGTYIGHPADDTDAIASLMRGRDAGAGYFALPAPMRWWDDIYPAFSRHLSRQHRRLADHAEVGALFELTPGGR